MTSGNENVFTIELEEETKSLKEVTIDGNKVNVRVASLETPLSVQRLTAEEIRSNPGGSFDISKVIQTLPGLEVDKVEEHFGMILLFEGVLPTKMYFI